MIDQQVGASTALARVTATVETVPVAHRKDAADDPAIWIHPTDPSQSTVIGTDKRGALEVYDIATGQRIQSLPFDTINIDVRYNFPLGGRAVDLVAGFSATKRGLLALKVNPATRMLEDVSAADAEVVPGGGALYHSKISGHFYYFANNDGTLTQYRLVDNGSGSVTAQQVRTVPFGNTESEGVVADDMLGQVYVSDEFVGIWKLSAEPDGGSAKTLIDKPIAQGGRVQPDVEGLAIYSKPDGTGYLLASSQGNSSYTVYRREGANAYMGAFELLAGNGIDATTNTDGIEVTSVPVGTAFDQGVFIAQDGQNDNHQGKQNQNFKLVRWDHIASALGLSSDTRWDPRGNGAYTRQGQPTRHARR